MSGMAVMNVRTEWSGLDAGLTPRAAGPLGESWTRARFPRVIRSIWL